MARFARSLFILLVAAALPWPALAATKKKAPTKSTAANKTKPTPKLRTPRAATPPPKPTPRPIAEMLADGQLEVAGEGAIVIDARTGLPLWVKNPDATQYPASTTKIMTALLVIEAGDLEREVEVAEEDAKVGEAGLGIKPGERYTRRQMLFGLMLKSANDVAHALGRDNAGTMPAFAEKMTARARELGARNTSFRNPHGLHDAQHFTNARDLAAIARAAMEQPYFRQIVATRAFSWPRPTGPEMVPNHNKLLLNFPGCTGVKTGFTRPAQQVLVSAALGGGREVIAVVMHSNKPGIWDDSTLLLTYGLHSPVGRRPPALGGK